MYEGEINPVTETDLESEAANRIDDLDIAISNTLQSLEDSGLNMQTWNSQYENLPEDVAAFNNFYQQLLTFREKRDDALTSFEFRSDMSDVEREKIRQFDREVMRAYKDHDNFLGNGASAEVYAMADIDTVCVKFITSQEQYNTNNHISTEFEILSHVYEHAGESDVKTPYPIFSRIHATEGHSYGMEKIHGASLSQILEFPEKYPELVVAALKLDPEQLNSTLLAFVDQLHTIGVVHCDLYKRNIMLTENGELCVIDYGKAKRLEFPGAREEEKKSDLYNAKQSLANFFAQLKELTNVIK